MWGVATYVSNPNIKTACTTAFKNITDVHVCAPSCPRIRDSHAYFLLAFQSFSTTIGQSSPLAIIIYLRFLNDITLARDCQYTQKEVSAPAMDSSTANLQHLLSAPLYTGLWLGGGHLGTSTGQTCHTQGRMGGGGFPPQ